MAVDLRSLVELSVLLHESTHGRQRSSMKKAFGEAGNKLAGVVHDIAFVEDCGEDWNPPESEMDSVQDHFYIDGEQDLSESHFEDCDDGNSSSSDHARSAIAKDRLRGPQHSLRMGSRIFCAAPR